MLRSSLHQGIATGSTSFGARSHQRKTGPRTYCGNNNIYDQDDNDFYDGSIQKVTIFVPSIAKCLSTCQATQNDPKYPTLVWLTVRILSIGDGKFSSGCVSMTLRTPELPLPTRLLVINKKAVSLSIYLSILIDAPRHANSSIRRLLT